MPLTSTITSYDTKWPQKYNDEACRLNGVFGKALVAIHHVGSTAVPHLSAKPEIDILVIVADLQLTEQWTLDLGATGYRRGGDLSAGHLFYKRDVDGIRTHKIHVCRRGHKQIERMLTFRDYLRANPKAREQYEALKRKLEQNNTQGIDEYLQGKEPFIEKILSDINQVTAASRNSQ